MNYLRNRRFIIFLFAIIILFFSFFLFDGFSSGFHLFGRPVWNLRSELGEKLTALSSVLRSKQKLLAENAVLEEERENLRLQNMEKEILRAENLELKGILGRGPAEKFILGAVLIKPNRSPYDSLIIDLGQGDGIKEGQKVLAADWILLGEVEQVFSKSAKVRLYSTPGEKIGVIIRGYDIFTELVGRGGGGFEMKLHRGIAVAEGTEILVPSIDPYLVATVEKVISDPRDPFQEVYLRSPVNFQHLKWVQILGD